MKLPYGPTTVEKVKRENRELREQLEQMQRQRAIEVQFVRELRVAA